MTLRGKQINGDQFSCTGTQLVTLLHALNAELNDVHWYVADLMANHSLSPNLGSPHKHVLHIGDTKALNDVATQVDQFLSGVFLAVPSHINPQWSHPINTEDEPTRALGDAILEIRAFDTSYFELYTSKFQVLDALYESLDTTEATVA